MSLVIGGVGLVSGVTFLLVDSGQSSTASTQVRPVVGLGYAGVEHTLVHDTMSAIASCPPGRVEVIANYTAFLQLQRALARHG